MSPGYGVDELVPHSGTMSLLDEVLDDGDDWLRAMVTVRPDTLFVEERGVPAWVGIEYMAQAIAAFAGLQRRRQGLEVIVGFLVGTRRYQSNEPWFPVGCRLEVRVEREFQADNGLGVFACEIRGSGGIHAECALNIFQPEDVDEYLEQGAQSSQ